MPALFEKAASAPGALTHKELVEALTWPDADELFAAAYAVKCREIGKFVSFRGLIEFGNVCEKNCFYLMKAVGSKRTGSCPPLS